MKKTLTKITSSMYYYKDNERIEGVPEGVRGNLSGITGDFTNIRGDLSYISGDLTGIRGDLTGIRGDLNDCEITDEERAKGIDIKDLII
jgi:hypothetical protein